MLAQDTGYGLLSSIRKAREEMEADVAGASELPDLYHVLGDAAEKLEAALGGGAG